MSPSPLPADQADLKVIQYLIARYQPRDVLDIGCGQGEYTRAFRHLGVTAFGLSCHTNFAPVCRWVVPHDFVRSVPNLVVHGGPHVEDTVIMYAPYTMDMTFSFSLVGALSFDYNYRVMDVIVSARRVAAFSHLPPEVGLSGADMSFWVNRMNNYGFDLDTEATEQSRRLAVTAAWRSSGLVFIRSDTCV